MGTPMFTVDTNNARGEINVIMKYGNNDELIFVLSGVVSKKSRNSIDDNRIYKLVNSYLDYKGDVYKAELYAILSEAYDMTRRSLLVPGIVPLPLYLAHKVLDHFDLLDVFNFLKHVYKLPPPSDLLDAFDERKEKDKQATRVQTYLKDDYLELAALTVIIKVAILPIAEYGLIKAKDIRKSHLEYDLFEFIKTHKIFDSPPMVKLLGHITLSVNNPSNSLTAIDTAVLENQISRSEIPNYLLAIVIMQRLSIVDMLEDCNDAHVVTMFYTYVNSRLKGKDDMGGGIMDKRKMQTTDSEGEKESYFETSRIPSALSGGEEEEMDWAFETVDKIMFQLPKSILDVIDPEVLRDGEDFAKSFRNGNIDGVQIELLSILFKSVINARSLAYMRRDTIINMFAVGFAYLWGMGFKNLALLLMSQCSTYSDTNLHSVNSAVGRERLSQELKDQLDLIAPNRRPINDTTSANILEDWITSASAKITRHIWIQVVNDDYVIAALGNKNYRNLLSTGIRIQLAEMLIMNERLSYDE